LQIFISVYFCFGSIAFFIMSSFGDPNTFSLFTNLIGAVCVVIVVSFCGFNIYIYMKREYFENGKQKFSVLFFVFLLLFYLGCLAVTAGFGNVPWTETTVGEIMSYYILQLVISSVIFTLPNRMDHYDVIVAQVRLDFFKKNNVFFSHKLCLIIYFSINN
jgi:hypothetical protein